jgi:hypothetical protein
LLQRRTVSFLNVCQLRCAVPSTLLAERDVEKIQTIRPFNTCVNPPQEDREAEKVEGGISTTYVVYINQDSGNISVITTYVRVIWRSSLFDCKLDVFVCHLSS